jgi:hypothetical protein
VLYLRGMQYQQERQVVSNPGGSNQYQEVEDKLCLQPPEPTAARLAKQHGVSQGTIKNSSKYTQAVDMIASATSPETRKQILSGELKLTQAATLKLAKLAKQNPAVMPDILEEISQATNKTAASAVVQRSTLKIEKTPMSKDTARLIDFDNATDAINWLKGKFTLFELAESFAKQTFDEEAETIADIESNKFNGDEEEED